jgi:hypothetical protein
MVFLRCHRPCSGAFTVVRFPHNGNRFHTARQPIGQTTEIGQKLIPQRVVFHTNFGKRRSEDYRPTLLA